MSDQNTSLPIRTQADGDVVAKLGDGTTPSQYLAIDASGRVTSKLHDGAGNALTSQASGGQQALDVGINVAGVQVDPRSIRALTSSDVVTANQGTANTHTNAWFTRLTDGTHDSVLLSSGELTTAITQPLPAGTNTIGAVTQASGPWTTTDAADGSVTGGTAGTKSMLAGGQYNTSLPTLTNTQQAALQTDSSARLLVGSIASALPAGTNNIGKVSIQDSSGAAITASNPLNVVIAPTAGGTLVNKYNTTAAVASNATTNHDYTITSGKTFTGRKFWASASGAIRADVLTSPDGTTFTTFWTGFNSTAEPNIDIQLDTLAIQDSGTGSKIRIVITNRDKAAMDVYSTISGSEA